MIRRFIIGAALLAVLAGFITWGLGYQRIATPGRETRTAIEKERPTAPDDTAVIADQLEVPWEIVLLPADEILATERPGRLVVLAEDGVKRSIPVEGVVQAGEGGLLGAALHPAFATNRLLYLYVTGTGAAGGLENRVERYTFDGEQLADRTVIIDGLPASQFHNGGRVAFGPDNMLYVTTGDAGDEMAAQNRDSLAGKILRLRDDGSTPSDNPFGTAVYSYGHRNPQGLAWDEAGRLWSTEHGRSGLQSGLDEINLIKPGQNYGWPVVQGGAEQAGLTAPVVQSGPQVTWAPAGAAVRGNSLFFTGLRGQALYEAVLDGETITHVIAHRQGEWGRLRAVIRGPNGSLYVSTSNTDGRGNPHDTDDRILQINSTRAADSAPIL